jgi:4-amino-4-deoxy-L-arabinose transferase-like glycosyltransferase
VASQLLAIESMTSRDKLELLVLTSAVAVTRFAFRSRYLYDLDSVNFALGMGRFDPRVHQPHPPGYFLYICLGRLLNTVFHDANLALVVLSIAASCGAVAVIYRMALNWFGRGAARFAGGLFLLSPLAWFHGTVALTYSVEAFFSALLGYLCWRVACGAERWIVPAALTLGISAGVRPPSLLFLGPLFLFSLVSATAKGRLRGAATLLMTLTAWFVPMIAASGGVGAYFGALFSLWRLVPSKETVFNSSPATSIARVCTIVFIYFLCFGAASWAPLGARHTAPADPRKKIFTAVWIAPALAFFTLIFLKFVNSGYLLIVAAPACIWLGFWASEWYRKSPWRRLSKQAAIGVCAAANVLIFLFSPLYCSYRSMRGFEAQLVGIQRALPQAASANDTLIIAFDSHFLGYRHAGYYLPGYLTVEYPEINLREGAQVFAMHERDTRLLAGLPAGAYTRFVLFPLPGGEAAYREYVQKVGKLLPSQSLRTTRAGDYDFVTGPISDLPLLFPKTAAKPGVYALLHSGTQPVNSRAHPPESPGP